MIVLQLKLSFDLFSPVEIQSDLQHETCVDFLNFSMVYQNEKVEPGSLKSD